MAVMQALWGALRRGSFATVITTEIQKRTIAKTSLYLALLMGVNGPTLATSDLSATHSLDIPAQDLGNALQVLGTMTNEQLLFSSDAVAGKRSTEVKGTYTTDRAIVILLRGSGLKAERTALGVLLIRQAKSQEAKPPTVIAHSGTLRLALAGDQDSAGSAQLAVDQTKSGGEDNPPDTVIVTGTRQTTRTVTNSLSPIDVVTQADLQNSGFVSARDMLASVAPSANVSNAGNGNAFALKTFSLRGLGSDQVLVLVNGKRRHNSSVLFSSTGAPQSGQSPPDLDLIPTSAIDHIEVLRDGAAAQYGSDALAGVVNIILKNGLDGNIGVGGGTTYAGDGPRGNFVADDGIDLGNGGRLHLFTDISGEGITNRAGPVISVSSSNDTDVLSDQQLVGQRLAHQGQPGTTRYTGGYNMTLPLSNDKITVYSDGTYANRDTSGYLTYRLPNQTTNDPALYPLGHSPRLDLQDEDYQVVLGSKGDISGVHWDLSTSYGSNHIKYQQFSSYNQYLGRGVYISPSDIQYAGVGLGADGPQTFAIGGTTSAEWVNNLDLTRDFNTGAFADPLFVSMGAEYRSDKYEISPGDPNSYAGPNGNTVYVGNDGAGGIPPSLAGSWGRHNSSAYADIEQTVFTGLDLSGAVRYENYSDFGQTTNEKGSFRYEPVKGYAVRGTISTGFRAPSLQQEHYSSFGTLGSAFYSAAYGNSELSPCAVGLPTAPYSDAYSCYNDAAAHGLFASALFSPNTAVAKALGAAPLKPEQSTNYSLGFVFDPIHDLTASVDIYDIKIDNRILMSGYLTYPPALNVLNSFGYSTVRSVNYFGNFADTTTAGVDAVINYVTHFDNLGVVKWGIAANINHTKFDAFLNPPNYNPSSAGGANLIDRASQGSFTNGSPTSKLVLTAEWNVRRFELFLRGTRYGTVISESDNPATSPDQIINPTWILDISAGYNVTDQVKVTVGADNALNKYPPVIMPVTLQENGANYYNASSPWGISGGYYYGRLAYSF